MVALITIDPKSKEAKIQILLQGPVASNSQNRCHRFWKSGATGFARQTALS